MMPHYFGIDPGKSGAVAVIDNDGSPLAWIKLDGTEHDVSEFLDLWATPGIGDRAVLERVNSMPGQGVSSSFKFGESYGMCRGLLVGHAIPFDLVHPSKWQGAMGCRTGGDKNISKSAAQRLFPKLKITHANADAHLLAEYCRRLHNQRNSGETS